MMPAGGGARTGVGRRAGGGERAVPGRVEEEEEGGGGGGGTSRTEREAHAAGGSSGEQEGGLLSGESHPLASSTAAGRRSAEDVAETTRQHGATRSVISSRNLVHVGGGQYFTRRLPSRRLVLHRHVAARQSGYKKDRDAISTVFSTR